MSGSAIDVDLPDADATDVLGRSLAATVSAAAAAGAIVHLHGEVGAGKTSCVRSFLRALGVTGLIRSPTYTLVEIYPLAQLTCVHVDLYRLQSPLEVEELGLREVVGPGCVMLIEWPEKGGRSIPTPDLDLVLNYRDAGRGAGLSARSSVGEQWLEKLVDDSSLRAYVSILT